MTCKDDNYYVWRLVQGDDSTRVFEYKQSDDTPVDLTGVLASCIVNVGIVEVTVVGSVDGPAGSVTVKLPAVLTDRFLGNGAFKLRLTMPNGDIHTLVYGDLVVTR